MAKVKTPSRSFEDRLADVLQSGLDSVGIGASIAVEPVRGTKLHRVQVTSPAFEHLRPSERQDLVWRMVGQAFTPADQLRISIILTMTPKELRGL